MESKESNHGSIFYTEYRVQSTPYSTEYRTWGRVPARWVVGIAWDYLMVEYYVESSRLLAILGCDRCLDSCPGLSGFALSGDYSSESLWPFSPHASSPEYTLYPPYTPYILCTSHSRDRGYARGETLIADGKGKQYSVAHRHADRHPVPRYTVFLERRRIGQVINVTFPQPQKANKIPKKLRRIEKKSKGKRREKKRAKRNRKVALVGTAIQRRFPCFLRCSTVPKTICLLSSSFSSSYFIRVPSFGRDEGESSPHVSSLRVLVRAFTLAMERSERERV